MISCNAGFSRDFEDFPEQSYLGYVSGLRANGEVHSTGVDELSIVARFQLAHHDDRYLHIPQLAITASRSATFTALNHG